MGTSMKDMFKGLKYTLSQMFVKEPEIEIEIGLPTDVKHVSHIGWDGPSGTAPSWMSEFNTGPDFAKSSIGNNRSTLSPWFSQDSAEPTSDLPPAKRRQRRKKTKGTSSSKSNAGSTSSRSSGAKRKSVEDSNKKISRRGTDEF